MKTLFRILKYVLVLLVVLLIALLAFAATFDANNYKPQIIEQVEKLLAMKKDSVQNSSRRSSSSI